MILEEEKVITIQFSINNINIDPSYLHMIKKAITKALTISKLLKCKHRRDEVTD